MFNRIEANSKSILKIPHIPGVYRFIGNNQEIIYIGASGNLQKRVSQYFRQTSNHNRKHQKIKQLTRFIEYQGQLDVESAFEAERIEIWTNQPVLNIRGNTVHSFSYLIVRKKPFSHLLCYDEKDYSKITLDDEFYRINTHMKDLIEKLEIIRRKIPFCMFSNGKSCWDYQLNLCTNNCRVTSDNHDNRGELDVHALITDLISKESALIPQWEVHITDCVSKYQFEQARKFRTTIEALESLRCSFGGQCSLREVDKFSFEITNLSKKTISVQIKSFADGKNISRKQESIQGNDRFTTEILILYFLMKYYRKAGSLPNEVHIDYPLSKQLQIRFDKRIRRFYHRPVNLKIINNF